MLKKISNKVIFKQKFFRKYSTKYSYIHHVGEEPLRAITVGQLLQETANKFGGREAIISRHQNKRINFQKVLEESDRLAAGLSVLGLKRYDRIGIWTPNLLEWYLTKMAAARSGLMLVGLNPAYQHHELEYCINKVGIKAIVCSDKFKTQDYYEILTKIAPELRETDPGKLNSAKVPSLETIIMVGKEQNRGTYNFEDVLQYGTSNKSVMEGIQRNQSDINPDDPCNIQFTSGTTGRPKAAVTSHFNLVNNGFYIGKRNELNKKHHKICVQVPFFHAFGTTITIMAALNHGTTLVLPTDGYSPDKSLDAIKEEKCTIVHGTPTMYVDLVHRQEIRNEDITPEIAVSGGAICSPHLFRQMLKFLRVKKVKSVYGLSETTAVAFHSMIDENEEQSTSTVGRIAEHLEAKIIDSEGRMVPLGAGGELCVRGYCNMLGYWEDEEKTKEMIGNDGWLKTGDQFIISEDGYGKIIGRLKEMIIRGGENIFPKEIEEYLNTHPNILETYVIGLPHERLGEEVCACIRVKPGTTVTHDDIVKYCKGEIAHFKIPSKIKIVNEFPKTTSGKIQKFKLIDIVLDK